MRSLLVFENLTVNGCFSGPNGELDWAYQDDPELDEFTARNAAEPGVLVLGRVTYEQMASFWPSAAAAESAPVVAKGMNEAGKIVFSRTLRSAEWANTTLISTDPCEAVRRLKELPGRDLVVLGSGSLVAQLAGAGLVDALQLVVRPVALPRGRTLFEGMTAPLPLALTDVRSFRSGTVVLSYTRR